MRIPRRVVGKVMRTDFHLVNSKVTGLLMIRREHPCQSRPSQGYLIANAHRISYRPGGPDRVLDLSAPPRLSVPAGAGALFSSSAPGGVQLAVGVAPRLRGARQSQSPGPAWSSPPGLPALPAPAVRGVLVHEDLAVVVRRASHAGAATTRGWYPVSGGRQHPEGQAGTQASGGPQNAPQPVPSVCLR